MSEAPPFLADLAEARATPRTMWRTAEDGVRLRVAVWLPEGAVATILLFPGRTEYIEKYGRVANELTARGLAIAAIDWRGQGMSDRLADDPALGHVGTFPDYQKDVAVLLAAAREAGCPEPFRLLAHSMGGCIGLRALIEGLPVASAVFSAPMWDIYLAPHLRPLAAVLPGLARMSGHHMRYAPGTRPANYVTDTGFEENLLTTDRDHYLYLARHAAARPDFALGGPSLHWFSEARKECRALAAMPRPSVPAKVFYGGDEGVVSIKAIHAMLSAWPSAEAVEIPGARHELMMEAPDMRTRFMDGMLEFFGA